MMATEPVTQDTPPSVEEQQVAVAVKLSELSSWVVLVDALIRMRGATPSLGFQTPGAQAAIADMEANERDLDTLDREVRPGRQWERPEQRLVGGGHTPVPVASLPALTLSEEIAFVLHHIVKRTIRALDQAGLCPIARLPTEPTVEQLLAHIRQLVWASPSPTLLASIDRDLTWLNDKADRLVRGDTKTVLPDNCPWCDRPTLIVFHRDDLIICGADTRTRRVEPCVCSDPYCQCKTTPITHRHEWVRNPPSARNSWANLSGQLAVHRTATTEETP